jgi:hypothetical protein
LTGPPSPAQQLAQGAEIDYNRAKDLADKLNLFTNPAFQAQHSPGQKDPRRSHYGDENDEEWGGW